MGFDVLQMGFDIPGDARTIRPDGGFDVPYVIADTGSIIPDGGRLYAGGGCSASCSVPMHAAHHARNTWYFALGAAITVMATRRRRRSSDRTKRVA